MKTSNRITNQKHKMTTGRHFVQACLFLMIALTFASCAKQYGCYYGAAEIDRIDQQQIEDSEAAMFHPEAALYETICE